MESADRRAALQRRRPRAPSPRPVGKRSSSLAVPLVKALTERVARVAARAPAFVHYGSTSQDVLDTALVLY